MAAKSELDPKVIEAAKTLQHTPWCDEYEKMISGMMYDPLHPKLMEGRHRARCLAHKLNHIDPSAQPMEKFHEAQADILKDMVGRFGTGSFVEPPFLPDYGCNVSIGKNCFANFNLTILDVSLVTIGDRVQFGPNVSIYTAGHDTSVLSRIKFVEFGLPVAIEDDAWIGGGTIILPGVTVGKGSSIGAGSVVTKNIPPYSVAVGSPARVIKTLPTVEQERADPNNPYNQMVDRE
ncbi:acetyltransferase C18B11.09c [Apiospora kogelbergensis]|uniref:Acetyltransferase C18B11.09c n=1 Tax=Apiospora kogelbergensis TaxID=1337665 RepID=A0AAW0RE60_9PEZI